MTQQILQLPYTSQEILQLLSKAGTSNQDGSWIQKSLYVCEEHPQVNVNTELTDFRTYLPDDNSYYEVRFACNAYANSGSIDNYCNLYLYTEDGLWHNVVGTRNTTASACVDGLSTLDMIISPSHKLFVGSNQYADKGYFTVRAIAYRKLANVTTVS